MRVYRGRAYILEPWFAHTFRRERGGEFTRSWPRKISSKASAVYLKAMHGTRDVAQNWEMEYAEMMAEAGLKQGSHSACVFYNKEKNVRVVFRGDDCTVLGPPKSLDWFREAAQERTEVTFKSGL